MTLRFHNTLTKTVEPLQPLHEDTVSIYSCGPTVYDHVHIGNLSAFIVADVLRRTIRAQGTAVTHVMNFTDVDDKTIRRSAERYPELEPKAALQKLTRHYSDLFLDDMQAVGNDTEALTFINAVDDTTIDGMRQLITELYTAGFAYIADDGVYFSIDAYRSSGKTYGQLVTVTEANTSSQRIQNDEYDKDAAHDFALWKTQKAGEPAWDFSLDGTALDGRPGWHIECSVMSRLTIGQPFDIHTGGIDLAFPHHENEIAQSTAGKDNPTYARTFVHNEHILVDGRKMSKSLGNFYTLQDLIEKGIDPIAFRLLVLQSHYRNQTNFSLDNAQSAASRLQHWRAVAALRWQATGTDTPRSDTTIQAAIETTIQALGDDLDTPQALRAIDDVFSFIESTPLAQLSRTTLSDCITTIDTLLGLRLEESTPDIDDRLKQIMSNREQARRDGDYALSDTLRDALLADGIIVKDTPDGTIWSYAK